MLPVSFPQCVFCPPFMATTAAAADQPTAGNQDRTP